MSMKLIKFQILGEPKQLAKLDLHDFNLQIHENLLLVFQFIYYFFLKKKNIISFIKIYISNNYLILNLNFYITNQKKKKKDFLNIFF